MSVTALLARMGVLFAFLLVGLLCAKLGWLDEPSGKKLNKLVLNVCAPSIVLSSVLNTELEYALGDIAALLWQSTVLNVLLLLLGGALSLLFFRRDAARSQLHLLITFGNTVFMGFPVVASVLGDDAVFLASMCSIPFNVFVYSVGVVLAGGKGSARQFFLRLLNPPFLANFVAFALFLLNVRMPGPVIEVFDSLGSMVVPLSMMLIGLSLAQMSLRSIVSDRRVYVLALCKLILAPVAVFFVMRLFVRDTLFLNLFVIISAMPCASVLPILCGEYGGDEALASKSVLVTTVLSLGTLPLMLALLLT